MHAPCTRRHSCPRRAGRPAQRCQTDRGRGIARGVPGPPRRVTLVARAPCLRYGAPVGATRPQPHWQCLPPFRPVAPRHQNGTTAVPAVARSECTTSVAFVGCRRLLLRAGRQSPSPYTTCEAVRCCRGVVRRCPRHGTARGAARACLAFAGGAPRRSRARSKGVRVATFLRHRRRNWAPCPPRFSRHLLLKSHPQHARHPLYSPRVLARCVRTAPPTFA